MLHTIHVVTLVSIRQAHNLYQTAIQLMALPLTHTLPFASINPTDQYAFCANETRYVAR